MKKWLVVVLDENLRTLASCARPVEAETPEEARDKACRAMLRDSPELALLIMLIPNTVFAVRLWPEEQKQEPEPTSQTSFPA